jgi:hypothetical protein
MSLDKYDPVQLRVMPCAARIDPCDDMMTVAADLDAMPPECRQAFMQAWEAWAAERGMGVRFTGPWAYAVIR